MSIVFHVMYNIMSKIVIGRVMNIGCFLIPDVVVIHSLGIVFRMHSSHCFI